MRSALSELEVVRPRSLAHALAALHDSQAGERLVPLAGGTDLFVHLNAGTPPGKRYLNLWGLPELRGIRIGRDAVTLGALTTFREIRDHAVLQRRLPALVAAASEVGAWQIQNRATIAGNIANASPAGDSLPPLLAHDAVVRVGSVRGEREVPLAELFTGYRALAMAPDELITAVRVPIPPAGTRSCFRKVGTRRAQSISKVVFCGLWRGGRAGGADLVRLAWGSVAPVPVRARGAEQVVRSGARSAATVVAAREALARDITPIDDIRSSRDYRLTVAGNLLALFLRTADPRYA